MQSSTVVEDKLGYFSVPAARNAVVRKSASIIYLRVPKNSVALPQCKILNFFF